MDSEADIAEAVALLVSDRGKFMAGVNYRVDGGMSGLTNVHPTWINK